MFRRGGIIGLAVTALLASAAAARPVNIINSIPAACRVVVVFHNLQAIDRKIVALEKQLNLPVNTDPLQNMQAALGINGGLDINGSAAVVFMAPPATSHLAATKAVVGILPAANIAALKSAFQAGQALHGIAPGTTPNGQAVYLAERNGYLLLAPKRRVLREYLAQPAALNTTLPAAYNRAINGNDLSVYVNVPAFRKAALVSLRRFGSMTQMIARMRPQGGANVASVLRLEILGIKQILDDSSGLMITVRSGAGGLTFQTLADMKPGTPLAQLLEAQSPLAAHPLAGLPGKPYLGLMAYALNGQAVADWLGTLHVPSRDGATTGPATRARPNEIAKMLASYRNLVANATGGQVIFLTPAKTNEPIFHEIAIGRYRNAGRGLDQMQQFLQLGLIQSLSANSQSVKVTPQAMKIEGVSFTSIKVGLLQNTLPAHEAAMARQILQIFMGGDSVTTYVAPISSTEILAGANVDRSTLAAALTAARKNADPLDRQPAIVKLQRHVLAHPNIIMYVSLDRLVSSFADRMQAIMADGDDAGPPPGPGPDAVVLGAPTPLMVESGAITGDRVQIESYLPMLTLVSLVNKGRELFGMMLMQGMGMPPQ